MSHDVNSFLKLTDANKRLICVICQAIPTIAGDNKLVGTPCNHYYCYSCIRQQIEINPKCPMCRMALNADQLKQADPIISQIHRDLKLFCPFKSNSCRKVIPLRSLDYHLSICWFNPENPDNKIGQMKALRQTQIAQVYPLRAQRLNQTPFQKVNKINISGNPNYGQNENLITRNITAPNRSDIPVSRGAIPKARNINLSSSSGSTCRPSPNDASNSIYMELLSNKLDLIALSKQEDKSNSPQNSRMATDSKFRVIFKNLDDSNVLLNTKSSHTIKMLKDKFFKKVQITEGTYFFSFQGKPLIDNRLVSDYDMKEGSTINVFLRLVGG